MVTDAQVRRLMRLLKTEKTLAAAAAKAGMDEKTYREEGPGAFFGKRSPKRRPRVPTGEGLDRAQGLLDAGQSHGEVAAALGIKADTLYRTERAGRLVEGKKRFFRFENACKVAF